MNIDLFEPGTNGSQVQCAYYWTAMDATLAGCECMHEMVTMSNKCTRYKIRQILMIYAEIKKEGRKCHQNTKQLGPKQKFQTRNLNITIMTRVVEIYVDRMI